MATTAIHILIHGRVQGVSYRNWLMTKARRRGLTGWVRNRVEGTVEAVLCGEPEMIELMIARCWKGPLRARVRYIETQAWTGDNPIDFKQLPTLYHV